MQRLDRRTMVLERTILYLQKKADHAMELLRDPENDNRTLLEKEKTQSLAPRAQSKTRCGPVRGYATATGHCPSAARGNRVLAQPDAEVAVACIPVAGASAVTPTPSV
jgi:hypothetical protein